MTEQLQKQAMTAIQIAQTSKAESDKLKQKLVEALEKIEEYERCEDH